MANHPLEVFRYPHNVGQAPVDKWILFQAKKGRHIIRSTTSPAGDTTLAACAMYLPEGALRTTIAAGWDGQDVGSLLGAAIEAGGQDVEKFFNSNLTDLASNTKGLIDGLMSKIAETGGANAGRLAMEAVKSGTLEHFGREFSAATGAALGQSVNPRTDLIFSSVPFRTHEFEFTLIPRNLKEAQSIDNIVKFFQYYMLPSFGENGTASGGEALGISSFMIGFPHEFEIEMRHSGDPTILDGGGKPLRFVNRIGRSVLKSCAVDHAGGGKVSFIKDGGDYYPTATKISLQFEEVRLLGRDSKEVRRDDAKFNEKFPDKLDKS